MALSGQLSDLSLAELIEFFCHQRKTGRLKVAYERTPGYFYFDRGDLVDAKLGSLNGVEAIYYALTLKNASFKFSPAFEPTERTIHQPWTQVTLEGLRRLDEGIKPKEPQPESRRISTEGTDDAADESKEEIEYDGNSALPLSLTVDNIENSGHNKMVIAAVILAIIALVAVIGIPAGWYSKSKEERVAQPVAPASPAPAEAQSSNPDESAAAAQPDQSSVDASSPESSAASDANALAAKRERESRERQRLAEAAAAKQSASVNSSASANPPAPPVAKPEAAKPAPKMVSVQVTYDEAGRVTQTNGGDSTAQRIARQKRFPAGKAGTTTITIPIN